jgi:hypothetical protein
MYVADEEESFDFYISTTGTGTAAGGGTIGDPWGIEMLINATAQARYAGKRVGLMDGTYYIPVDSTEFTAPYWDVAGLITGGATYAENAIIGTTEEWVTFKNLEITDGGNKLLQILASNVTVEGCEIHDIDNDRVGGAVNDNTDLIRVEGGGVGNRIDGIVIRNCSLHDASNSGDGTWETSSSNAAGVKLYDVDGCLFEYNTCYNLGSGFGEKINSAASTVRYNFFHTLNIAINAVGSDSNNFGWDGTPSSYTAYIHNNVAVNVTIFHETDAGGFAPSTGLAQVTHVYNNTIYGQSAISGNATYWITYRDAGDADLYNFKNNIMHLTTSSGSGMAHQNTAGKAASQINATTTNYNLYPGTLRWLGSITTLVGWRTECGGEAQSDTTNPNFVSAGTLTPESYKISGAALTAGEGGTACGAYITQSEQIGVDF